MFCPDCGQEESFWVPERPNGDAPMGVYTLVNDVDLEQFDSDVKLYKCIVCEFMFYIPEDQDEHERL